MADRVRRAAGAAAVAVLAGCLPACLSPVPLDPAPQADLDPRLVGAWRCVSGAMEDDDAHLNLKIARARERVFSVEMGEPGKEPGRYEAHASLVDGRVIVNVRDLSAKVGAPAEPWDFAEYELLRPDLLVIRLNDHDAFEGVEPTPAALRARIAKPGAFAEFCVCVRGKDRKD